MRLRKYIIGLLCLFFLCSLSVICQSSGENPANCEQFRHEIDEALLSMDSETDSVLIFILKPGAKEDSKKLLKKRMTSIESFIKSRSSKFSKYVIAEAPKTNGLGKLEIYLRGRLISALYIKQKSVLGYDCSNEPY
jgi:hypothetical protein